MTATCFMSAANPCGCLSGYETNGFRLVSIGLNMVAVHDQAVIPGTLARMVPGRKGLEMNSLVQHSDGASYSVAHCYDVRHGKID